MKNPVTVTFGELAKISQKAAIAAGKQARAAGIPVDAIEKRPARKRRAKAKQTA
ncbi:MAG TPA: hypothetical protein VGC36_13510 [Rhizomicrobium sp.]